MQTERQKIPVIVMTGNSYGIRSGPNESITACLAVLRIRMLLGRADWSGRILFNRTGKGRGFADRDGIRYFCAYGSRRQDVDLAEDHLTAAGFSFFNLPDLAKDGTHWYAAYRKEAAQGQSEVSLDLPDQIREAAFDQYALSGFDERFRMREGLKHLESGSLRVSGRQTDGGDEVVITGGEREASFPCDDDRRVRTGIISTWKQAGSGASDWNRSAQTFIRMPIETGAMKRKEVLCGGQLLLLPSGTEAVLIPKRYAEKRGILVAFTVCKDLEYPVMKLASQDTEDSVCMVQGEKILQLLKSPSADERYRALINRKYQLNSPDEMSGVYRVRDGYICLRRERDGIRELRYSGDFEKLDEVYTEIYRDELRPTLMEFMARRGEAKALRIPEERFAAELTLAEKRRFRKSGRRKGKG